MTEILIAYATSVAVVAVFALLGWGFNYAIATDAEDRDPAYVAKCFKDARACLAFIPWTWAWPYLLTRAFVRALHRTLEETR